MVASNEPKSMKVATITHIGPKSVDMKQRCRSSSQPGDNERATARAHFDGFDDAGSVFGLETRSVENQFDGVFLVAGEMYVLFEFLKLSIDTSAKKSFLQGLCKLSMDE